MRDRDIMALFWNRSERAITETKTKYGGYCEKIVSAILEDPQDREECISDAFLRLWDTIPPNMPDRLKLYLARILRNLALDRLDKQQALKRGSGQPSLPLEELLPYIPVADNTEQVADRVVLQSVLNRLLATLRPQSRKIFLQRYWYSQSVPEIAEEFGLSKTAVKTSLQRSKAKLKSMLEEEEIYL